MANSVFPQIDLAATGERIKSLREERNISVRELQNYLGFEQPQAIYKWQKGQCLPSSDNLYAIACFFNVAIDDILVGNRQDVLLFMGKLLRRSCLHYSYKMMKSSLNSLVQGQAWLTQNKSMVS